MNQTSRALAILRQRQRRRTTSQPRSGRESNENDTRQCSLFDVAAQKIYDHAVAVIVNENRKNQLIREKRAKRKQQQEADQELKDPSNILNRVIDKRVRNINHEERERHQPLLADLLVQANQ